MIFKFRVTSEKNAALLRNAEISQQMEIVRQDMRRQESEMSELLNRITHIEEENKRYKEKENKGVEQQLRANIIDLEDQLNEKNKVSIQSNKGAIINLFGFKI